MAGLLCRYDESRNPEKEANHKENPTEYCTANQDSA